MHGLTLLQDIAIVMAVSAAVMLVFHRFRLPIVLGYILAGLIIGPYTPPFPLIRDMESVRTLSELGVIFLLFGIGLEFSLTKLLRVGVVSFFAATLEIVLMLSIGYGLGRGFGWNPMDSLFLGAILSISSTTIIAKVLQEMGKLHEPFAQIILGILIVEDVLAIVIIALLSGLASTGALTLVEAGAAMLKVGSFVAGTILLGLWLVPRLLRYLDRFPSGELLVVTVLGLCFGVSLIAAQLGFSVALGAFLIGAVIAETPQAERIVHRVEPIRDMFTAIFFVSVGMLLDPKLLVVFAWPIAIIALVTIVGKVVSCSFATFLTGYPPPTALRVGLGLAQIGEFSFIIAALGESTAVTSRFLYPLAVSVSGVTTLTTPLLMRQADPIVRLLSRLAPMPLVTVANLYLDWLERVRQVSVGSEKQQVIVTGLQRQMPRLLIYAGSALALGFLAAYFASTAPIPPTLYWILAGVALTPLLFAAAYTIDRTLWDVLIVNIMQWQTPGAQQRETQDALHNLLRFVTLLLCGFGLLALSALFVPFISLSVGFVLLVGVTSLVFWGSARRVHERMERVVLQVFDREQRTEEPQWKQSHDELVQLIRDEYPWDVQIQDMLLPYNESAVNQPLRALRVRAETGATVVAIYRGAESLINPSPDMALQPGDVLLLMGSQEQIQAALEYLGRRMREPAPMIGSVGQPKTHRFEVPADSRWAGKSLGQLNLRRQTEAQIVGIQKPDRSITNPDATVIIEVGDVLILFGRGDQLSNALHYLSA